MKKNRVLQLIISIFLIVVFIVSTVVFSITNNDGSNPGSNVRAAPMTASEQDLALYLPILQKNYPWVSPFGVEADWGLQNGGIILQRATELDAGWVRMNHRVKWIELQENEGDPIDWSKLDNFEDELRGLKAAGITPVITINHAPRWATVIPSSCAAIRADKFNAFANFVGQLVERYSQPEFNVHNWEFGNEPDIDPSLVGTDHIYGCWGDIDDPYYGGEHYGNMLKTVTPVVKAEDPGAKVWIGGLLLDNPGPGNASDGSPELFLQGILEAGAAPYFDNLPVHAYFGYNGLDVDQDNAATGSVWYPLGGYVVGKSSFLRDTMSQYGVDKPIYFNEIALNCPPTTAECNSLDSSSDFWQIQANQLVRSFVRGLGHDVSGYAWFTLNGPGWRDGSLLDGDEEPRYSFIAYQNLTTMLNRAEYSESPDYGSNIEAYRFSRGATNVEILWSKTYQTYTVTFPQAGFVEALDRDGTALTPTAVSGNYTLDVGFEPVYLVFED